MRNPSGATILGNLGDPRAVPLLEWIRDHEREPVLKGKSLGDVAATALRRIAERAEAGPDGAGPEASGAEGGTTR